MAVLMRGHRQLSAGTVSTVRFAELEKKEGNIKDERAVGEDIGSIYPSGPFPPL